MDADALDIPRRALVNGCPLCGRTWYLPDWSGPCGVACETPVKVETIELRDRPDSAPGVTGEVCGSG